MTLSAPNWGIEIFNGTRRRLAAKKADFRAHFIRFSGLSVPTIRYEFQIAKKSILTDMRSAKDFVYGLDTQSHMGATLPLALTRC